MRRPLFLLLLIAAAATVGCSAPSAEDLVLEVMETRLNYDATLQSWIVRPDGSLYLDVLVVNNNNEQALRTLTVMIEQLDAEDEALEARRVVLEVLNLTPGMGEGVGVTVAGAAPGVEGIRLFIEARPEPDAWAEFPEFEAVRPRI